MPTLPPEGYFNDRLVMVIDHLLDTRNWPSRRWCSAMNAAAIASSIPPCSHARSGRRPCYAWILHRRRAIKQQLRAIRSAITR